MKEIGKRDLAIKIYNGLLNQLNNEGRSESDLRKAKHGFLVCWRTMAYLKAGDLKLKPKRTKEVCDALGIPFHYEIKYFS